MLRNKLSVSAFLSLTPTWIVVLVIYLGTLVWSVNLSFTNSRFMPSDKYIGFYQYEKLFHTARWLVSIENLIVFGVLYIGGCLCLGFILAASLDRKVRFENTFRTIFLYPYAMSFVVTGVVWQWILNPTLGVQSVVRSWGWETFEFNWIVDPNMAIYTVVFAAVWQGAGLVMVILLASMKGINEDQWKAARIEGIPVYRMYLSIILPQLTPAISAASMILGMAVIKTYDLVVALTSGGPGYATEVPAKFIMDNLFERQNIGLAAAGATVLLVSVLAVIVPIKYAFYLKAKLSGSKGKVHA
ncbi:carbohydrate ABC transporter permease [Marinomonas sp.]|uniref:carbohydrate ABC transporter permease n=1 Tax=Marinomonas sp. TaxID=1904862 RepID=UPI003BA94330